MTDRTGALFSRTDVLESVELAENLGYESAWASEGRGKTAFGKLERWATVTDEIGLATGIVNVFSRSPATIAQAVATLDDHSDGRAILGLGVASPRMIEDFHGIAYERPLDRMYEYVGLVRRYLEDGDGATAGSDGAADGEFHSPGRTRLSADLDVSGGDIPIYNAALGPANVRLTGQVADGWLPNLYPTSSLEKALGWLEAGAERAGRDVDQIDVAMYVLAAVDDDPDAAADLVATHVATYLRDVPGFYDRVAADAGFRDEVRAAKAADSIREAAGLLPRALLDRLGVFGTEAAVRDGLDSLRAAGVDLPIVRTPIGADETEEARLLRVCAPG